MRFKWDELTVRPIFYESAEHKINLADSILDKISINGTDTRSTFHMSGSPANEHELLEFHFKAIRHDVFLGKSQTRQFRLVDAFMLESYGRRRSDENHQMSIVPLGVLQTNLKGFP